MKFATTYKNELLDTSVKSFPHRIVSTVAVILALFNIIATIDSDPDLNSCLMTFQPLQLCSAFYFN